MSLQSPQHYSQCHCHGELCGLVSFPSFNRQACQEQVLTIVEKYNYKNIEIFFSVAKPSEVILSFISSTKRHDLCVLVSVGGWMWAERASPALGKVCWVMAFISRSGLQKVSPDSTFIPPGIWNW